MRRLIPSSNHGLSNIKFLVRCVIFGAPRIDKNCVILDFIIATLPVNLFKIPFTHFLTAFRTPPIFCVPLIDLQDTLKGILALSK